VGQWAPVASQSDAMSEVIVLARQLAGWSQEQLADAIGIRQQSVAQWESGGGISKANVARLQHLLPFEPGELLTAWATDDYERLLERLREQMKSGRPQPPSDSIESIVSRIDRLRIEMTELMAQAEREAQRLARSAPQAAADDHPEQPA
jgi:transcriptional regulator with XRE-family HTH domain